MREPVQSQTSDSHDPSAASDAPVQADQTTPLVRHVLVLPERDSAEEVIEELVETLALPEQPQLVREALAGEDDAEDAQWLVVLEGHQDVHDPTALDELAASYEGWLERD